MISGSTVQVNVQAMLVKSILEKYFECSIFKILSTVEKVFKILKYKILNGESVSYTHLTLPTKRIV